MLPYDAIEIIGIPLLFEEKTLIFLILEIYIVGIARTRWQYSIVYTIWLTAQLQENPFWSFHFGIHYGGVFLGIRDIRYIRTSITAFHRQYDRRIGLQRHYCRILLENVDRPLTSLSPKTFPRCYLFMWKAWERTWWKSAGKEKDHWYGGPLTWKMLGTFTSKQKSNIKMDGYFSENMSRYSLQFECIRHGFTLEHYWNIQCGYMTSSSFENSELKRVENIQILRASEQICKEWVKLAEDLCRGSRGPDSYL